MSRVELRAGRLKSILWTLALLWTGVVFALFLLDSRHLSRTVQDLAVAEARTILNKDQSIRLWAASHGGVYVPVSANTQPNPFLAHLPERDIQTPSGRSLTLLNPAYMIRQLIEHYADLNGVQGRIVGIVHFSAATAPDGWEKAALTAFRHGNEERLEVVDTGGDPVLRMIRALATESECLKCHAKQGHRVGDIRGGISVSVPMTAYLSHYEREMTLHGVSFAVLWLIGVGGTLWAGRSLSRSLRDRDRSEQLLRLSQGHYKTLVASSLTGIYIAQGNVIRFANARFADTHGYTESGIIGVNAFDLIHPEDRGFVQELARRRLEGKPVDDEYEVRCVTRDGRVLWVQRRNTLIEYDGQAAVLGNEIDITRRKEAEATLRASEEELKRLSVSLMEQQEIEKRHIATGIHENIAQCLSAIKLRVESVLFELDDYGPDSPKAALAAVISDVQHSVGCIRTLAADLRPMLLDDMGLGFAVAWACRETGKANPGLRILPRLEVKESRIPDHLKIVVFRTIEHILKSAAVRGRQGFLEIGLQEDGGSLMLRVKVQITSDFPPPTNIKAGLLDSMSVQGMKLRIESSGGKFLCDFNDGNSAILEASWPG